MHDFIKKKNNFSNKVSRLKSAQRVYKQRLNSYVSFLTENVLKQQISVIRIRGDSLGHLFIFAARDQELQHSVKRIDGETKPF